MTTPGTPEYRKHLRDQTSQYDTTGTSGDDRYKDQLDSERIDDVAAPTQPPTPDKFPTGEDTNWPVNNE